MRVAAVLLALLLAGCASSAGPDVPSSSTASGTGEVRPACVDDKIQPVERNPDGTCPNVLKRSMLPVDWAGTMAATYQACEGTSDVCAPQLVAPQADHLIPSPGNTLVNASLEMTWTATSQATQRLTLGLMIMSEDDSCTAETTLIEATGTSPISFALPDLNHSLDGGCQVHLYVYNAGTVVWNPPVYVYATPEQAFTVTGTLGLRANA